ncbi:hypothetical protein J3Q64DRAFT_1703776 [Phycomyces blakesleeanus]|uniref:Homeodomain-like DNA binding domain-containing transcription factor n=1 Tax=Phycomyces blakesleeanus TaxID=4837 RepID=A0ABR3AN78_PHYBL
MSFNNLCFFSVDPTQPAPHGKAPRAITSDQTDLEQIEDQLVHDNKAIDNSKVEVLYDSDAEVTGNGEVEDLEDIEDLENFEDIENDEDFEDIENNKEFEDVTNAENIRSAGEHKRKVGHLWNNFLVAFRNEQDFSSLPQHFKTTVDSSRCNNKFKALKVAFKKESDRVYIQASRGLKNVDEGQLVTEEPETRSSSSVSLPTPTRQSQTHNTRDYNVILELMSSTYDKVMEESRAATCKFAEAFLGSNEEQAEKNRMIDLDN